MPCPRLLPAAIAVLCALPPLAGAAGPATPTASSIPPWQFEWNARLRREAVDDDAFARDASATTLRLRAGIRVHAGAHVAALLEGEGIASAGDAYNSGANGRTDRPSIADARGVEVNQAWLAWTGTRGGGTVGRQRLVFDNQRWIGNSGWRQNEQTFDAAALAWHPRADLSLQAAWLDRVHRVNGPDARDPLARERALSTALLNASWTHGAQQLVGYAYRHDDRDVATASTLTRGVRWTANGVHDGTGPALTLERATQRDTADNPLSFQHAYWLVEPSVAWQGTTWRVGWEHLGGNGVHALQTPLATLHAFNGWADRFTVTPNAGLEDRYAGVGGRRAFQHHAGACTWQLAWHDFRADRGTARYGREWDASVGFPVRGALTALVKVADFHGEGGMRDTRKLWLQLEWSR